MKNITIQLKRLGKKKIKKIDFVLDLEPEDLGQLIESCVRGEVRRFNEKREEVKLTAFLSPKNIQEQSKKGKIGFGDISNTTLADENEAIENAFLAFKDGLFVVFLNDEPIESLDTKISLDETSVLAFMRMTFLSGTYW